MPPQMSEYMFLKQALGTSDWVAAALLISILYIVAFRRESIVLTGLFRLGVAFFALSIALPPFAMPVMALIFGRNAGGYGGGATGTLIPLLFSGSGPVFQALTVMCLFNAMMPRVFGTPKPAIPEKHPLD